MDMLAPSDQQARLLLTSSGLTHPAFKQTFQTLLKQRNPHGSPKVLYIPDGILGNGYDAQSVQSSYVELQALLRSIGVFSVDICELRRTSPDQMRRRLQGVDAIVVDQGNTFYLRYYMRTSGFDQLVPSLVREGVVYVGASSGSIAAGASVRSAFWKGWDDPGYGQEWDLSWLGYDGMGLIPGGKSLFPHYASQYEALVKQGQATLGHEVVVLGEDHAYVCDCTRGEYIVSSAGEVMPLKGMASAGFPAQRLTSSPVREVSVPPGYPGSYVAPSGFSSGSYVAQRQSQSYVAPPSVQHQASSPSRSSSALPAFTFSPTSLPVPLFPGAFGGQSPISSGSSVAAPSSPGISRFGLHPPLWVH